MSWWWTPLKICLLGLCLESALLKPSLTQFHPNIKANLLRQSSVMTNLPHSKGRLVWVLFHVTCTAPGPNLVWGYFRCAYNLAAILNIDKTGTARHILWAVFSNIFTEKYVLKMVCWNTTVHFSHRRWNGLHILVMILNAAVGVAELSGDCYKN